MSKLIVLPGVQERRCDCGRCADDEWLREIHDFAATYPKGSEQAKLWAAFCKKAVKHAQKSPGTVFDADSFCSAWWDARASA